MRSDIIPGGVLPDYALPELAAFQPKIAVAYTRIVTISTDDHHTLQEFRASVGARWTFRSDPGRMDLSAPRLGEAWTAGDRSPFHGWDTRPRVPVGEEAGA
jgi:hypothetical protein